MGLQPVSESAQSGKVIWQKVWETAQGGFTLDPTGLDGTILAGTPILFDEATRMAKTLKVAEVQAIAGGTATDYRVKKGHNFIVGDIIGVTVGGKAYAITVIDTSNADYDTLTVGTSLGAAAVGDSIFHSSATGATAAALKNSANGFLYEDFEVGVDDFLSPVIRGTMYANRVAAIPASVKTANPLIIFSNAS